MTEGELKGLIADFDSDGNGTISLVEFRSWCYQIPHLTWKAERLRFEKGEDGAQSSVAGAPSNRSAKSTRSAAGGGGAGGAGEAASIAIPAKLHELYKGTKLFWHTREKLEIVISESKPYECLVVNAHNETACKVCKPIFIDLALAMSLIDAANFEVPRASVAAPSRPVSPRLTPSRRLAASSASCTPPRWRMAAPPAVVPTCEATLAR